MKLQGVLPVFHTPYHEDLRVDDKALLRQIDWLFERGVDGVVYAMVSEVLRHSDTERRAIAQLVCQHVKDRGAVVISVGAESTYQACELARHAQASGADGVMVIPPVSTAAGDDQLASYYGQIIEAISIPVVVQDASGYVGRPMSIAMQAGLFETYGSQVMFKPEAPPIGPRLSQLRDKTSGACGGAGGAPIFEGTGGVALVESFRRGVVGTMPGADLIEGIVALWKALHEGDEPRIYALSQPITALVAMLTGLDLFLAVEKHLLCRQGVFTNTLVRGPVGSTPDAESLAEIDRLFDQMMETVHQAV